MEIIPAIDIIDGRCVRLAEGDFARRTTYSGDPADIARAFEDAGCRRLHLVDLDGAKLGRITNLAVLERVARATSLKIDFGGGIKRADDIRTVFGAGAAVAAIGSVAVRDPELFFEWIAEFGGERVLLGADVRGRNLAIDGWQTATETEVVPFLRNAFAHGVRSAFVTDIARDGMLAGPAAELYREIIDAVPGLELIASGGVASEADLVRLASVGCRAAILGKALYEGRISLQKQTICLPNE
jgi:phosphoribosylformimino-5-aminoimidazole carboxamide ribotide isomerase